MMTRFVGLSGFGLYCVVLVLMEFAARLAVFGTDVLIVKAASTSEQDGEILLANAFGWRGVASVAACSLLIAGVAWLRGSPLMTSVVAIMGLGMIAQVLSDTYLSLVQGMERVHLAGYVQMLCHAIGLALALAAIWCGLGLVGVAVAYTLRAILFFICGAFLCRLLNRSVSMSFGPRVVALMLRKGAPIAGGRLLAVLYLGSGVLVMQRLRGEETAGLFAGSMKIFEACAALGMLTAVSAFPTLSRLRTECTDSLREVVTTLIRIIAWVGLPLCVLLALNAESVLVLLFGSDFAGQDAALSILTWAIPFSFVFVLFERLAYAANAQKQAMLTRAAGTVVCISVLVATVPHMGLPGAAMAYLIAEVAMVLLLLPKLRTYAPGVSVLRTAVPGATASLVALAAALAADRLGFLPSAVFALCFGLLGFGRLWRVRLGLGTSEVTPCVKADTEE